MLSLPLIAPQNEYSFFLSPHLRPSGDIDNNTHPSNPGHPTSQSRRQNPTSGPTRSSLAQLQADELAIATRKHNIRRFGAGWIKPPGVAKTLQAETEERAEREEQEALQRREQMMMDMQAQQEAEEARARAAENADGAGDEGEEEERDLDEEIPDADADVEEEMSNEDLSPSEEEEEEDEDEQERDLDDEVPVAADVSFNDESLLENSFMPVADDEQRLLQQQERYARLEEAELTGIAQDEADLGIERDLDDSVPEAGSYQHTDSELEDSSDEEEDEAEEGQEQSQMEQEGEESEIVGAVMQRSRSSLLSRDVSSLLDSSFVSSSPVLGRLRSAGRGSRR